MFNRVMNNAFELQDTPGYLALKILFWIFKTNMFPSKRNYQRVTHQEAATGGVLKWDILKNFAKFVEKHSCRCVVFAPGLRILGHF